MTAGIPSVFSARQPGGRTTKGRTVPNFLKSTTAPRAQAIQASKALKRLGINGKMKNGILVISDSESKFVKKINSLQNDAAWREAMWRTFYNVYIKYSVEQAKKRGFTSALTIGSFVDTALNQGATGDSGSLQGILSRSGSSKDEKTFMTKFYAERTKIVDTNDYNQPPNGKNRVKQWSTLLNMGETDLKNADAAIQKVTDWELK